jgi:hypothetical protein
MNKHDLRLLGRDLHRFPSARTAEVEPMISSWLYSLYTDSDGFDTLPCTYLGTRQLALGSSELPDKATWR